MGEEVILADQSLRHFMGSLGDREWVPGLSLKNWYFWSPWNMLSQKLMGHTKQTGVLSVDLRRERSCACQLCTGVGAGGFAAFLAPVLSPLWWTPPAPHVAPHCDLRRRTLVNFSSSSASGATVQSSLPPEHPVFSRDDHKGHGCTHPSS